MINCNHVHTYTRFDQKYPTRFPNWTAVQPILAKEIEELIQAHQSNNLRATIDEAGDVLYVASYGLRFSSELQKELAAVGRSTTWSQMHYFSPASETITLFIDNISPIQRLAAGGAEISEIRFEPQSL